MGDDVTSHISNKGLISKIYFWHLNNVGLNFTGLLLHGFFFNQYLLQDYTIYCWLNLQMGNCGYKGPTLKLCANLQLHGGLVPQLELFKGQLHEQFLQLNYKKQLNFKDGQRIWIDIFRNRRHPNGQWAYEKMLNIINYQENANQSHSKILPHTSKNGYYQKDKK